MVMRSRQQQAAQAELANAKKTTLYMAIPQGVFQAVKAVMDKFEKTHPDVTFQNMVDTPEAMVEAIKQNKSKPDIFISPGGHEAEVLHQAGLLDPATMTAFGSYDVALLVPKGNPGKIKKLEDLMNPEVKVISFSYTDLNSASFAAKQSLINLGLWDKVKGKVKETGCCMSSFRWILDGRAEANVQFLGCPVDPKNAKQVEKSKVDFACVFPRETVFIPRNVAGVLKTSKQPELALEFVKFMGSPENVKLMIDNRLRNDQNLPLTAGTWGPENEKSPMPVKK